MVCWTQWQNSGSTPNTVLCLITVSMSWCFRVWKRAKRTTALTLFGEAAISIEEETPGAMVSVRAMCV